MTSHGKTPLMRTTRTAVLTLAATLLAAMTAATTANAGIYTYTPLRGYQGSELTNGSAGWVANTGDGYGQVTNNGTDLHIEMAPVNTVPAWTGPNWAFTAPTNTRLSRIKGSWNGWARHLNAGGDAPGSIIDIYVGSGKVVGPVMDYVGTAWQTFDGPNLDVATAVLAVGCRGAGPSIQGPTCYPNPASGSWGWAAIKDPIISLRDDDAPTGSAVGGTIANTAKLTGSPSIDLAAADAGGGVAELRFYIDGALKDSWTPNTYANRCTMPGGGTAEWGWIFGSPRPCPLSVTSTRAFNTTTIADGNHTLTYKAVDAAQNETTIYSTSRLIANQPPINTTEPAFINVTDAARPAPGLSLDTKIGTWGGPNLTYGQQWQRCEADGGGCTDIPGATGTRYTPVPADVGRRLRFVVTAVNVAGTLTKTTTMTGVVAAAEQSPTAVAQNPSTVIKTPDLGAAGGGGEGRGNLNGTVTGSDTGGCNKDQFQLRATRYKGRIVHLRYGRGVAIRVKLTCQTGGYPVAGAKLQTATLIPGQSQAVGGELITDKNGEAILRAPKGPSRGVTIGYRNYTRDDLTRAELRLRVAVRGKITLTVRQGLNGRATFGGRVIGGYIPPRGVTVQLQFLDPRDGWRPVKNMKTDSRGRYRYAYQFKQPVSFKFRAVVAPGQVDYPFMPAHSTTRIGHG